MRAVAQVYEAGLDISFLRPVCGRGPASSFDTELCLPTQEALALASAPTGCRRYLRPRSGRCQHDGVVGVMDRLRDPVLSQTRTDSPST